LMKTTISPRTISKNKVGGQKGQKRLKEQKNSKT